MKSVEIIACKKIISLIIIVLVILINNSCNVENHIDRYNVNLDSLQALPDNFYAYRRGRVYIEDINARNYRIWLNQDKEGNVQDVFKIENISDNKSNSNDLVNLTDTPTYKLLAQQFVYLSRLYKFGHIYIKKENKISFSYIEGVAEQYVKALNDSISNIYANKENFRLLKNNWFENIEQQ